MIFRVHIHTICEPFIVYIDIWKYFIPLCGMLFNLFSVKILFPEKKHKHFLPRIGLSALEQGDKWRCNGRVSITSSLHLEVTGALPGVCSVIAWSRCSLCGCWDWLVLYRKVKPSFPYDTCLPRMGPTDIFKKISGDHSLRNIIRQMHQSSFLLKTYFWRLMFIQRWKWL